MVTLSPYFDINRNTGVVTLLKDAQSIAIKLDGERRIKNVKASILQAGNISDFNSFEKPNKIAPTPFAKATVKNNLLRVNIPPKSIIVLKLN